MTTTTSTTSSTTSSTGSTTSTTTTGITQVPPNYTSLASTVYASTVSSSLGTGTLCAGSNVVATSQASFPIYPGAYNYQKVALSNNPTAVYEVECYMNANSGSQYRPPTTNVYSLEYCIDLCNQVGPAACTVAYWAAGENTCTLYPTSASGGGSAPGGLTPNSMTFNKVRTARLLTAAAPNVVDATYLLGPSPQYNLGLCTGPGYYDKAFIGVYHLDNTIRPGRADLWFVNCFGNTYYSSGIASNQLTPTQMTSVQTTAGVGAPATADDCARLCAYANVAAVDAGTLNCRLWHWLTTNSCVLFSSRGTPPTTPNNDNTIVASGLYRGSTGEEYTQVASYKRSLPPGVGPKRSHARDALADTDHLTPDVIIPFSRD
ncbi:hypothetical protein A1O1_03141 [Capronia coronata CBS 617.96]|uniref:Uncharacterized protein n=1 Tax=Capronia coronata CBS 617.96 TaxID=1182541 RepID=W9ZJN7_9EURO|nr:uncharacterized protein A1O1_03141 [Capronia coronata CBS 617.96]EXJ94744.1 hypothetical protein A1O1_03141 [Capronia coronata CBS 617.96]